MANDNCLRRCRPAAGCAAIAVAALAAGGCGSVTTYGATPRDLGGGRYSFTLYYNTDATEQVIDAKAAAVVASIREEKDYAGCAFERSPMAAPWRVKEVSVEVSCE
ncbi:MAG: hypothetical protein KJO38_00850 [Gammaproteobacteria bacterium]|nr:hypothetical protein [Gammaproteobacteria bacterium]